MWGSGDMAHFILNPSAVGRASGELPVPVGLLQVKRLSVRIEQGPEPVWKI